MFILKAPVKGYNGVSYGIRFIDGEGKTEDSFLASRLEQKGYKLVEEKNEDTVPENEEPQEKLEDLEYDQLQTRAKALGIKANQSKENLIEAIQEAKA
jgi:hypothetical protein